MTSSAVERLHFLSRVVGRQVDLLRETDRRLFTATPALPRPLNLGDHPELAERVEAFASRFARLQDTLGDKLLPATLAAAGEPPRTTLEMLDRAEKLGWIASADQWLALRKLRNQMVHEYVEDPQVLADALGQAHRFLPVLLDAAQALVAAAARNTDAA